MQVTRCDRCGADVPRLMLDDPQHPRRFAVAIPGFPAGTHTLDICADCYARFEDWMTFGKGD